MGICLYEYPPTRSQCARWVLEELGLDHDRKMVDLLAGAQRSPDYLAIHPLGVVPALTISGTTMFESVAIVLHLVDAYPEAGLAPLPGTPERALYYQWSVFSGTEMDPAIMLWFDNTMRPGAPHEERLAERGRADFAVRAKILSDVLAGRNHLLDGGFTGADILIGHSCFMAQHTGLIGDGAFPVLEDYYARLCQRPAHRRAYDLGD